MQMDPRDALRHAHIAICKDVRCVINWRQSNYMVGQKKWDNKLVAIILSNFNRFWKFFTETFPGKFAVAIIYPTTRTCCHTTLWNVNVRKQTINGKLQGSMAVVVSNRIKKGLLQSLPVYKFLKSVNNVAKLQARMRLSRALSFSSVVARCTKCTRQPRSCF